MNQFPEDFYGERLQAVVIGYIREESDFGSDFGKLAHYIFFASSELLYIIAELLKREIFNDIDYARQHLSSITKEEFEKHFP